MAYSPLLSFSGVSLSSSPSCDALTKGQLVV